METLAQCVKSAQSWQQRQQNHVVDAVLVSLLLALNRYHAFPGISIFDLEQVDATWVYHFCIELLVTLEK